MVGRFATNDKWACGKLTLNADHTFHQEISKGCGANHVDINGKWSVDRHGGSVVTISLTPFLGRNPDTGEVESFGFSYFTVNRLKWGPVRIVIDPDAGTSYDKQ
ncbi:MAG TPA: hypothetical protein VIY53_09665 [Acidobacteriaceae bacterium]